MRGSTKGAPLPNERGVVIRRRREEHYSLHSHMEPEGTVKPRKRGKDE